MRFIKKNVKESGFRLDLRDEARVRQRCGSTGLGSLLLNVLNLDTREWANGVKAIWSSDKLRIVDPLFKYDEMAEYLIEVVEIRERQKGERV